MARAVGPFFALTPSKRPAIYLSTLSVRHNARAKKRSLLMTSATLKGLCSLDTMSWLGTNHCSGVDAGGAFF